MSAIDLSTEGLITWLQFVRKNGQTPGNVSASVYIDKIIKIITKEANYGR